MAMVKKHFTAVFIKYTSKYLACYIKYLLYACLKKFTQISCEKFLFDLQNDYSIRVFCKIFMQEIFCIQNLLYNERYNIIAVLLLHHYGKHSIRSNTNFIHLKCYSLLYTVKPH